MIGPFPPAVGGLANNMSLLMASSLAGRYRLVPFSTAKRRTRVFPNRPHWDSLPYLVLHSLKLFASILRHRPQLIYIKATSDTGFVRDVVLMAVARLLGKPVLCHLHGRPMGRLFRRESRAARWVTRPGMRLARVTVVLSPGLAREFASLFPGQELVPIPNVADLTRFFPAEPPSPGPPLRILTVGRLSREKGTWDLLEVAARLRKHGWRAEFHLCGIGETEEEEKALRREAERLELTDQVHFLGTVRGEALAAAYQSSHVFFLPTHAEIFPNVVLEALASGLPVVTTDVPVIPEMFTEGEEGFLHSPGDVEAMAASLERLLRDPELRLNMGTAARRLAEARYGVDRAAQALGGLIEGILTGRDSGRPSG